MSISEYNFKRCKRFSRLGGHIKEYGGGKIPHWRRMSLKSDCDLWVPEKRQYTWRYPTKMTLRGSLEVRFGPVVVFMTISYIAKIPKFCESD